MTTISFANYSIPKFGNRPEENEDAYKIYKSPDIDSNILGIRCAIADGATQTSFSSLWARLLVECAIKYVPSRKRFWDITRTAQTKWSGEISKINLPWHAEEKVRNGAFSTLLWLSIKRNNDDSASGGRWKAIAIGDSNLTIIRNNQLCFSFPMKASDDFGNSPILLCSVAISNTQISENIQFVEGEWFPGDQFLLATDALSHYILSQSESGESPCINSAELPKGRQSDSNFEAWVQDLREKNKIHNDDTTVIKINIDKQEMFLGN